MKKRIVIVAAATFLLPLQVICQYYSRYGSVEYNTGRIADALEERNWTERRREQQENLDRTINRIRQRQRDVREHAAYFYETVEQAYPGYQQFIRSADFQNYIGRNWDCRVLQPTSTVKKRGQYIIVYNNPNAAINFLFSAKERIETIKRKQKQARMKSKMEIVKIKYPDAEKIFKSNEFEEWVLDKPKYLRFFNGSAEPKSQDLVSMVKEYKAYQRAQHEAKSRNK